MGFFDRLTGKKPSPASPSVPAAASPASAPDSAPAPSVPAAAPVLGGVMPRLAEARKKLEDRDLAAAVAIYEEILASAGDRPDILVTISGDLGSTGNVFPIIELIAPRYDADRHGPATGINILQAYLAVRDATSAQHILDLLFGLNRPELEDRLFGFSNAIADLMAMPSDAAPPAGNSPAAVAASSQAASVALVSFSKPMWFYGLEPLEEKILPVKDGRVRRIAFAQLSLPAAYRNLPEALKRPEDELGRLARGIPLWLAESFYFSAQYLPVAATGLHDHPDGGKAHFIFNSEWRTENLQQLVDSSSTALDYIFTGALRHEAGDFSLTLRLFEVKKFRERKTFSVRWTPATADEELAKFHAQIRAFMEWTPEKSGLKAGVPACPTLWIDALAVGASLFLSEKGLVPANRAGPVAEIAGHDSRHAGASEIASLAHLTLRARARTAGIAIDAPIPTLAATPLVAEARTALGLG